MSPHRRHLLQSALGLSALTGFGDISAVLAAEGSLSALKGAGLDPVDTYMRMFASTTKGEEVAWWFMGAIPVVDEHIGEIPTFQEETVRIHRTDANNSFSWTEAGVFREIVTGEVPTTGFDPVSGKTSPHGDVLAGKGMTATVTATKDGDGLKVVTKVPGVTFLSTVIEAKVDGDRVCLTHIEQKGRPNAQGQMNPNQTVFKIYANLADLKGKAPNVKASGYYGVRNVNTKKVGVNGLMHKAAMNEKVNPIAWERLKKHHPTFITGDRFTPKFGEG